MYVLIVLRWCRLLIGVILSFTNISNRAEAGVLGKQHLMPVTLYGVICGSPGDVTLLPS